jgi:hypothetical protein
VKDLKIKISFIKHLRKLIINHGVIYDVNVVWNTINDVPGEIYDIECYLCDGVDYNLFRSHGRRKLIKGIMKVYSLTFSNLLGGGIITKDTKGSTFRY